MARSQASFDTLASVLEQRNDRLSDLIQHITVIALPFLGAGALRLARVRLERAGSSLTLPTSGRLDTAGRLAL